VNQTQTPLLKVNDLHVFFDGSHRDSALRAVDGVDLHIDKGETVGLVGESGCGKSTLGNALIGLVPVTSGTIHFRGRDVTSLGRRELRAFRRDVQMVFQDPFGSLNPRMTVGGCISEILHVHKIESSRAAKEARIAELLETVGLEAEYAMRYPHEFSGGQRQRIGIARALALNPDLLIADEPVSALDVSVQVQILNLMKDLQKRMNLACLFVAHDLAVVQYMCDRVLVMYLGKIVESARTQDLFGRPSHPYTEALLSAIPDVDKGLYTRKHGGKRIVLRGDVPSATERIPGCPFHTRCHRAREICRTSVPQPVPVEDGHLSVCHFANAMAQG
jgi:oligopeptide/dipeptide ABC transporter ATP-binding protein